jgi:glycosyltransferase involved in cell wall biosynthesis
MSAGGEYPAEGEGLRVLHIGPTPFFSDRGCHIRIRGLVLALQRRGVGCRLATYSHGNDVDGVITNRIAGIPGYTRIDAGPSPFKYLADLLLLWKVCGLLRRWRPHVLHGHLHEGALIGWLARSLVFWRRVPLVFDMQGSLVGELEEHAYFGRIAPLRWIFLAIEWAIDRMPEAIACSSSSSLQIARERFGVPEARLELVPDGVDADADAIAASGGTASSALQLPADRIIVVYSGALLPVKGLDELHATIAGCADQQLPVHFLLVGYPTEPTQVFLDSAGLTEHCTLTGRVDFGRLSELLAAADIAIEPKQAAAGEASGKLLNYMAAGLPVVCFDTPNNREMLGETGCYASADSTAQLVDGIVRLAGDADRRGQLGAAARARALESYSWDTSAATLEGLYTRFVERSS